jgi:hypothetical protein
MPAAWSSPNSLKFPSERETTCLAYRGRRGAGGSASDVCGRDRLPWRNSDRWDRGPWSWRPRGRFATLAVGGALPDDELNGVTETRRDVGYARWPLTCARGSG